MKKSILLFLALIISTVYAQKQMITFNPQDCSNCIKGIELFTDKNSATYIFQEINRIDSSTLRKKYIFSEKAQLVFSDNLFDKHTLGGRSTISSENALLKCPSSLFDRKASVIFSKLTSNKNLDTLIFNFPISKNAFSKRIFQGDGKVYLMDMFAQNVVLFDMLHDIAIDTLDIEEQDTKKAFELFSLGDTTAYKYYRYGLAKVTHEAISKIQDFFILHDTLYLSIANSYFFIGGADKTDTFLTKFESIGVYKEGKYIKTIVPDDINAKLIHQDRPFTSEAQDVYYSNNRLYTSIYNGQSYNGSKRYAIGCYSLLHNKYEWAITLNPAYYADYNFVGPIFNNQYFILSKSSEVYSIDSGLGTDLKYFEQGTFEYNGMKSYPKYFNRDINVDDHYYNILYYSNVEKIFYYARINRKNNKLITTKKLYSFDSMYVLIDPYDSNYILAFMHPNKVIRMKVFEH